MAGGRTTRQPARERAGELSHESNDAPIRVLRRFRLVFNAIKSHFKEVEKRSGIGGAQLWALSVVRGQPGITVSALAKAMDVHQSTASNLVKGLVALEMLEVHRSGADRRAALLKVGAAGLRVLRRAPGPFSGVLPEALRRLDAATLERLDEDLALLLEVIDADERAARVPLSEM